MRGHVRKRGNTWSYVLELPRHEDGRRNQKWHGGFATRREAEAALTTAQSRLLGGAYVAPTRQTFGEYLVNDWLPAIQSTVRPSTFESYSRNIRVHVIPRAGGRRLSALDAGALNALYSELLTNGRAIGKPGGLSPRSVHYIHTIIHRALRDAVRWDRLARNVADAADPPRQHASARREIHAWDAASINRFLTETREERVHPVWLLLATTGMRRGEALGLRWADLDLDAGSASVRQTLITVGDEIAFGTPKTGKGTRVVALDSATTSALRSYKARQAQERLALGPSYIDNGLVFTQEDGQPLHPKRVSDMFRRKIAKLGLPRISVHGLRHTWATLALQAGIHPKVVSERLGHADIAITLNTYSHVTPTMQADAADVVARLVLGDVPQ
ncbi:MAG TPA: tyrosine-type recombinase/integrase [Mycobacteriales bacterium]|nr:tyrosine-type recombinase/integrase [Mycobacteriales bacterium]